MDCILNPFVQKWIIVAVNVVALSTIQNGCLRLLNPQSLLLYPKSPHIVGSTIVRMKTVDMATKLWSRSRADLGFTVHHLTALTSLPSLTVSTSSASL